MGNQHQSHGHWWAGRGSNFLEILRLKAVRLKSNRNWMWFDMRYGVKFLYIFYMPQLFFVTGSYMLTPVWRRLDDIEDCEPFVTYQQRKKPMTRRNYADSIKLVY